MSAMANCRRTAPKVSEFRIRPTPTSIWVLFTLLGTSLLLGSFLPAGPSSFSGPTRSISAPAGAHVAPAAAVTYKVTFTESGIPVGTQWEVNVSGGSGYSSSTGKTLAVLVPNGTYTYQSMYSAWGTWVAGSNGTFKVSGTSLAVAVSFTRQFYVSFVETGLPSGTQWSITISGTNVSSYLSGTSSTLGLLAPNGTDYFRSAASGAYNLTPQFGSVNVSGANVSVALKGHLLPTYLVTFTESGLPLGVGWSVVLSGTSNQTNSSISTKVTFSEPNGTYLYWAGTTAAYVPNPQTGYVTVNGAKVSVSIAFVRAYSVVFLESGLAVGTPWSVTLGGNTSLNSTTPVAKGMLPNGTYTLTVGPVTGYSVSGAPATLTVSGANLTLSVRFHLLAGYYVVRFVAFSPPAGTLWGVDLYNRTLYYYSNGSTTGGNLSFAATNGSYGYLPWASGGAYVTPANGTVIVNGANVTVILRISFAPRYTALFLESGLPSGGSFTVQLPSLGIARSSLSNGGTPGANVSFLLGNGSYPYSVNSNGSYLPNPANGNVSVNGAGVTVSVTFSTSATTYPVSFAQTGLPSGRGWSVTLGGTSKSSAGGNISFLEGNGSYSYTVGSVSGYTATPGSGRVTVVGAGQNIAVTFKANPPSPAHFSVNFTESGLPSGTSWSVDLNGTSRNSTGATIGFSEPNGSYGFTAGCGGGYTASPSSGYANVSGASVAVGIACKNGTGLVPLRFLAHGLAPSAHWSVTLTATSALLTIQLASSVTRSADAASSISFEVSPGSYGFTASASGFELASGKVDVAGSTPATVTVSFVPSTSHSQPHPAERILSGPVVALGIGLAAIGALGLVLTVRHGRVKDRERGRLLVEDISLSEWTRGPNGEPMLQGRQR